MSYNDTTLEVCDLCAIPLEMHGKFYRKINKKHGIVITLGFSRGGWGFRQNDIDFSGEVCDECYDLLWKAHDQIRKLLKERKDTRSPLKGFTSTETLIDKRLNA